MFRTLGVRVKAQTHGATFHASIFLGGLAHGAIKSCNIVCVWTMWLPLKHYNKTTNRYVVHKVAAMLIPLKRAARNVAKAESSTTSNLLRGILHARVETRCNRVARNFA